MKEYNVKIKVVKENDISILAKNRKEAFEKAIDLLQNTCLDEAEIKDVTKHYCLLDINNKCVYFFRK